MNPSELATLTVGAESAEIQIDGKKWKKFLAAAEEMGRAPEALLAESIDLCMDMAIAMATLRKRD